MDDLTHFTHIFVSLYLTVGNLNVQNSELKFDHFWNVITTQTFVSTYTDKTKDFLKHFVRDRIPFPKVKKTWWKLSIP
jgi:hypothetical protein